MKKCSFSELINVLNKMYSKLPIHVLSIDINYCFHPANVHLKKLLHNKCLTNKCSLYKMLTLKYSNTKHCSTYKMLTK